MSGAPVHFHEMAVNTLVYGTKHWFMYDLDDAYYSSTQAVQWYADELANRAAGSSFADPATLPQATLAEGDVLGLFYNTSKLPRHVRASEQTWECVQHAGEVLFV